MRILIVAEADPNNEASGAERVLAGQSAGLAARGHAVTLVAGVRGCVAPSEERRNGVRIVRYKLAPTAVLGLARLVRRLAPPDGFDVILFHQPFSALGLLLGRRGRSLPAGYVFLSPWHEEFGIRHPAASSLSLWFRRALEGMVLRRCRRVFPMSRFMAGRLRAIHGIPPERISVVPGGVDTERFKPASDRSRVRLDLGLPQSATLFFTLRNLEPRMGVDRLLRAVPLVARTLPDFMLVAGGQGPLLPSLQTLASELGLGERVRFTGFIPEEALVSYYQAADGFVIPTVELEGFGLPILEALACGTPVVGTRVGAIPEILEPFDSSLLMPSLTPEGIAGGILALANRPDRSSLSAACREYALSRYRWELALERLERELREMAE